MISGNRGRGKWGYGASQVTLDKRAPDTIESLERDLAEYQRLLLQRPELAGHFSWQIDRTERKLVRLKERA